MDFLKKNKMALGGGVVILLAGYVYFAYFAGSDAGPILTSSDSNVTLSQNLLVTLQNLHTIKLDSSIFDDPSFQSLTDFGVSIPTQNVGRRNPFLPLPSAPADTGTVIKSPITLPATH